MTSHATPVRVYGLSCWESSKKEYSNSDYVSEVLRFLLESGLIRAREDLPDLPQNWESLLYEEIKERQNGRLNKRTRGKEGSIINMLEIKKDKELRAARIRELVAATFREKLPHVYRTMPKRPSFPEIARIVGYSTHGSSHYAHRNYGPKVRSAIRSLTSLLEK